MAKGKITEVTNMRMSSVERLNVASKPLNFSLIARVALLTVCPNPEECCAVRRAVQ